MTTQKKIEKSGQQIGLTLAGVVAGNLAMKQLPPKLGPMATTAIGAAAAVAGPNAMVKTIGAGTAVIGVVGVLNQLSQPKDGVTQKGYQKMIASVTPQLAGMGINGLAEIDMSDYDFEPYEDDLEGIDEDDAMALLEGMDEEDAAELLDGDYDEDDLDDDYDVIEGLSGAEMDLAEALAD